MLPARLLRRLTALLVLLALAAPAWTMCCTVVVPEQSAGMPCCHHPSDDTPPSTVGGDCCTVQPNDPASAPVTAPASLRTAAATLVTVAPAPLLGSHHSHDRRAEVDSRERPKTAPYLLDSVLLI